MSEVSFVDTENNFSGSNKFEGFSFRQIVLMQVSRITTKMTVEFKGGYTERRPHPNQNMNLTFDIYVSDTRAEFINGVKCLHDLLINYFDKAMLKDVEAFDKLLADFNAESKNDEDARAELYRSLFRALMKLLFRLRYLEGTRYSEELGGVSP